MISDSVLISRSSVTAFKYHCAALHSFCFSGGQRLHYSTSTHPSLSCTKTNQFEPPVITEANGLLSSSRPTVTVHDANLCRALAVCGGFGSYTLYSCLSVRSNSCSRSAAPCRCPSALDGCSCVPERAPPVTVHLPPTPAHGCCVRGRARVTESFPLLLEV